MSNHSNPINLWTPSYREYIREQRMKRKENMKNTLKATRLIHQHEWEKHPQSLQYILQRCPEKLVEIFQST